MAIEPGLVNEQKFTVRESDTASSSGGSSLPKVLSTPRLIGWLERTAHESILNQLSQGQSSVGTLVNIRHLAATPVGMEVTVRAELLEVDRRRLRFKVEAWDKIEKIAEGEHERFIIDCDRFTARVKEKAHEG